MGRMQEGGGVVVSIYRVASRERRKAVCAVLLESAKRRW